MAQQQVRVLRVRIGSFEDLDPINMKEILESSSSQPERLSDDRDPSDLIYFAP